ncbi:MAG: 50S ribosomal protein L6 [Nitrosarchaeum sp.]|nr:50S ribosomal protein L6 [Nitrosarchaeum sp.]
MEHKILIKGTIPVPDGVVVSLDKGIFTVKGPKGTVSRSLHAPSVASKVEDGKVVFSVRGKPTLRQKKLIGTFKAHVGNLFRGVTQGHTYRLKVCSGHFPMAVALKGKVFEVKNFIGEGVPRTLEIRDDVKVAVNGDEIVVESISKEAAGQVAGAIEQLCRRPGFDARIFQDGIYIVEKDGKSVA